MYLQLIIIITITIVTITIIIMSIFFWLIREQMFPLFPTNDPVAVHNAILNSGISLEEHIQRLIADIDLFGIGSIDYIEPGQAQQNQRR